MSTESLVPCRSNAYHIFNCYQCEIIPESLRERVEFFDAEELPNCLYTVILVTNAMLRESSRPSFRCLLHCEHSYTKAVDNLPLVSTENIFCCFIHSPKSSLDFCQIILVKKQSLTEQIHTFIPHSSWLSFQL